MVHRSLRVVSSCYLVDYSNTCEQVAQPPSTSLTRVTTDSDGSEARVILFLRSYRLMEWELLSTIMSHFHLMKRILCGKLEFLVQTLLKLTSELCFTTLAKPFA